MVRSGFANEVPRALRPARPDMVPSRERRIRLRSTHEVIRHSHNQHPESGCRSCGFEQTTHARGESALPIGARNRDAVQCSIAVDTEQPSLLRWVLARAALNHIGGIVEDQNEGSVLATASWGQKKSSPILCCRRARN